jgi:hypothetical protein
MTDIDGPPTQAPTEAPTEPPTSGGESATAASVDAVEDDDAPVGDTVGRQQAPSAGTVAGDVRVSFPARSTPWRVLAVILAFAVVIGLGSWQFVDLHDQVHSLQHTTTVIEQRIAKQEQQVTTLHNSVRAALSCLETPQVQPSVCAHFLR